jgi:hypothetical protein
MHKPPRFELADVFRAGFEAYRERFPLLPQGHYEVANAIMACKSAILGGHVYRCEECGHDLITYNSCRNRHCPSCQALARAQWVEKRMGEILPVGYFHCVFTVPAQLNPFFLRNKELLYGILFEAMAGTMRDLAADPKRLGATIGYIAVLHTWGQNLMDHPHLHCMVPAGGWDKAAEAWKPCPKEDFLFPVKVMSRLFRGKFLDAFKKAEKKGALQFHGDLGRFREQPDTFRALLDGLYAKEWVVYCKPPFAGPEAVVKYLGRYTHRIAFSNSRLVEVTDTQVKFRWKDYAHGNAQRIMTLGVEEFIRRFFLHVLPRGFVRIRYYGFLGTAGRKQLDACMKALGKAPPAEDPNAGKSWDQKALALTGVDPLLCPCCRKGRMKLCRRINAVTKHEESQARVA